MKWGKYTLIAVNLIAALGLILSICFFMDNWFILIWLIAYVGTGIINVLVEKYFGIKMFED